MWNRKHVEFVRYDEIAWQSLEIEDLPNGLEIRILSEDLETGALSGILRVPAGWSFAEDFTSTAPEHLFLLKGDLQKGDFEYREQSYAFRPAGAPHGAMRSETGCEAIVMWDAKFTANIGEKGTTEGMIGKIDTIEQHWEPTIATGPAAGIKVKRLREVSETGELTFICGIMPNWYERRPEHHPCVEESFKIFGDMNLNTNLGDKMIMREDCYFYRPPFIKHGPLYTRTGTMSLVRTSAKLVNRYMPLEEDEEYVALQASQSVQTA
jgi:hypothetical protein